MKATAPAPMRLESVAPQFTVADVVKTSEYYRDILGFRIAGYWGTPPVFAIVYRDEVEIFFNRANGSKARTGRARGAYDAYFRVVGLEKLASDLAARGADTVEGPVRRAYNSLELIVRDCNGLVLAFGQDIPPRRASRIRAKR